MCSAVLPSIIARKRMSLLSLPVHRASSRMPPTTNGIRQPGACRRLLTVGAPGGGSCRSARMTLTSASGLCASRWSGLEPNALTALRLAPALSSSRTTSCCAAPVKQEMCSAVVAMMDVCSTSQLGKRRSHARMFSRRPRMAAAWNGVWLTQSLACGLAPWSRSASITAQDAKPIARRSGVEPLKMMGALFASVLVTFTATPTSAGLVRSNSRTAARSSDTAAHMSSVSPVSATNFASSLPPRQRIRCFSFATADWPSVG
mmetsp:Transcript_786/g.2528  ORF Transcript_786/g.2528 Transcript_786/m.2528 type:complete len:260 (-) Transcript_786:137-916(-)